MTRRLRSLPGIPCSLFLLLALSLSACGPEASQSSEELPTAEVPEDLEAKARRLTQEMILVDTHVDVPYRLTETPADISRATESGDFDYPRAKAGGLDAPFMSIYVPASYQKTGGAKEVADELIDMVEGFVTDAPDKFALATSPAAVRENSRAGKISLPLGIENGAPVEDDLANLQHFYDRGVRYITLAHSENNQICDSSYSTERQWNGLSPFGREVVAEMNRLGIMVDISHVSDETFYQVMELSQAPVIASHSSCRKFTPGFERNMDDDMIRLLAEKGGVIHINFGSAFISETTNRQSQEVWAKVGAFMEEHGLDRGAPEVQEFIETYRRENPIQLATVEDVADHIDHVVEIAGIDAVGIGSDYDGVGPTLPEGLKDVSQYPNLVRVLLERGYSEEDLGKLLGGNSLRVWEQVEAKAKELQGANAESPSAG
ncbi:MAG: dipeptidase [Acidobacteriota bacterium]|nr:dipeptidase [Acidobacteriota bacterium]